MIELAFDLALCALVLAVAVAALAAPVLAGSVVFFIVYGLLLALAWVRLGAPDVALAEAAIGAGLTGVLLLGAVLRIGAGALAGRDAEAGHESRAQAAGRRGARPLALAAALAGFALAGALAWAFLALPEPAGLQTAVAERLDRAGADNPVTAVLLNFRGWDTLLETVILLAALLGVWSLADVRAWGARPGLRQSARPGGVLATLGRVLPPLGLLVGVYLIWAGSKQPGGAFQGATVLAAVWMLVTMAGLMRAPRVASVPLRLALMAGPAVFLLVGLAGAVADRFMALDEAHAGALIVGVETVLAVSIAVSLALLVLGPPEREPEA